MRVLDAGISRVEYPEIRHRRTEQTLLDIGFPMRVRHPPRIVLGDRRHARDVPAEARL